MKKTDKIDICYYILTKALLKIIKKKMPNNLLIHNNLREINFLTFHLLLISIIFIN